MALCGCFPECACQLNVEPPELLSLTGTGDPLTGGWTLTAIETVFSSDHQNGGLSITPGGAYGHEPTIELQLDNNGASVELSVSPADGLRAEVVSVPGSGGGVPPGASFSYHGTTAPAGYLLEANQLVDIADYPDLFAVIGHAANGGVDPGGGQFRIPEGRGLVDVGKDDMGGVAAGRIVDAATGNATQLFGIGGSDDAQLAVNNLPAHSHTVNDPGHGHGVTDPGHGHPGSTANTNGAHSHGPATGGRSFVTVDPGFSNRDVNEATSGTPPNTRYVAGSSGGPTVQALTINQTTSIPQQSNQQQNNAFTDNHPGHGHSLTIANSGTGVSVDSNVTGITVPTSGGNGAAAGNAFLILQPYRVVNKIVKT